MAAPARKEAQSIGGVVSELKELTVSYAKQETIDPLKGLGRYVGLGVAGSALLGIGTTLLALAGLRALQTQTGSTFTGNLSWVPYVFVLAALLVLAGLSGRAIFKDSREHREDRT